MAGGLIWEHMFDVRYIPHSQITPDILDEIIGVKTIAWPFSYESQSEWIKNNLSDSDVHVILLIDKKIFAYLNLIEIDIEIDSTSSSGYGVGNVCAAERGKGWGGKLLSSVNTYLTDNNRVGMLFCKKELINFYSSSDWKLINHSDHFFSDLDEKTYVLLYNVPENFKKLQYFGKSF